MGKGACVQVAGKDSLPWKGDLALPLRAFLPSGPLHPLLCGCRRTSSGLVVFPLLEGIGGIAAKPEEGDKGLSVQAQAARAERAAARAGWGAGVVGLFGV